MSERMTSSQRAQDVVTRLRRTVHRLVSDAENARIDEQRWLAGYEAQQLLWYALDDLGDLVALLDHLDDEEDYYTDEIEQRARALADRMRARRIARKLERVQGRTPEEAEMYLERAAELRQVAR